MIKSIYQYTLKREKVGGIADNVCTSDPEHVVEFLKSINLHEEEQECLVAIVVGSRNNIRGYYIVTRGLVNQALAHPREVFRFAIINNATGVIIAHNHPSGDPQPSMKDIQLTQKIREAGNVIDIELIDHVIIGDDNYFSFRKENILNNNPHNVGKGEIKNEQSNFTLWS